MPRSATKIVPAGLLGLLLVSTQVQAAPADQSATAAAQDSTGQLSAGKQGAPTQDKKPDASSDSAQQRDAEAREKARQIIMQMDKKLGTQ
jgi:hypothetical protein